MRRQLSSKSNICTEDVGVDVAVISRELSVHYSGRSAALSTKRLFASRGAEKRLQKSADSIVGRFDPSEGLNIGTSMETEHG